MKKRALSLTLALALTASLAGCGGQPEPSAPAEPTLPAETEPVTVQAAPTDFLDWVRAEDRYKTVGAVSKSEGAATGYITDVSGKPTKEAMDDILDFTSKAVASGGENDVFLVVVEDVAMQQAIVGTNKGLYASEGTVTVLVYSERLVAEENQVSADGTVYKYQVDRGYYDAGIATGYFNLAATAYGYGTHMFQGVALAGSPVGQRSENYDQFLKDEDGNWLTYRNGDTTSEKWYGDHPTENLKFICAIVVGTMDPDMDIDGFTGSTTRSEYPANYAYWSGYTAPLAPWTGAADGTYTAAGASDSSQYTVEAVVEGGRLTGLAITEGREDMLADADAMDAFLADIVEAQNLNVDGISGATQDCQGVVEAVKGAFAD